MLNRKIKLTLYVILFLISFSFVQRASAAGCSGTGACYWVGGTGNWNDTTKWATASGGSTTGGLPTAADDAHFDAGSNTTNAAYAMTVNAAAVMKDLMFDAKPGDGAGGTITWSGSSTMAISGSMKLLSGMVNPYSGTITFNSTTAGKTITSNGVDLANAPVIFNGVGGSWKLQDAFSIWSAAITLTNGTLDTNSQSVRSYTFATATGTKILNLGTSTWTIRGANATIWSWTVTNATMIGKGGTIAAVYSGGTGTRTITMGAAADNPSLSISAGTDIVVASGSMKDLDFTGFSGTWGVSGAITSYGNLTLASGMTNNNTGAITFAATTILSVNGQDTSPQILAFSADGTKMYVVGYTNATVYQYALGTAWDTSTAVYTGLSKSVTAQTQGNTYGVTFSSDGSKMYITGIVNVYQYTLGTAWDVSTASYSGFSKNFSAENTSNHYGISFNSDGTKMFVIAAFSVYQYNLSVGWDLSSTVTYSGFSKDTSAQDSVPYDVAFNSDGTKMYVLGAINKTVYQYSLSIGWDLSSTVTYTGLSKSVTAQDSQARSAKLSSDGTRMYMMGTTNKTVYSYTLGVAWAVDSANVSLAARTISSNGVPLKSAMTFNSLYGSWQLQDAFVTTGAMTLTNGYLDTNSQSISSFSFATAAGTKKLNLGSTTWTLTGNAATIWNWSVTTATMIGSGATLAANYSGYVGTRTIIMDAEVANPNLSITAGTDIIYISSNGGNNYIRNLDFTGFAGEWITSGKDTHLYGNLTLGTGMTNNNAGNLIFVATSAKLVSAQENSTYGLAFNSDGTKMYRCGTSSGSVVYQYILSTAWDMSTAVYSGISKNVNAQDTAARNLAFNSDGTKMYIMGTTNKTVFQYTLGTAWDVSTASYSLLSKSVNSEESGPFGLAFSSDGAKMYVSGNANATVFQYTLDTTWNVSSAQYNTPVFKVVSTEDFTPYGVTFDSTGTNMYVLGAGNKRVYQYTLSVGWDLASTVTYIAPSPSLNSQDTAPFSLAFNSDGTKMYILGAASYTVYQYALSTPWLVSSATVSIAAKTITSNGVSMANSLTFNSAYGSWQLQDALTATGTILALSAGTFDPNSQTVSMTGAGTASITGAFTFYNFTRTGTAVTTDGLIFGSNVTVSNTLTLTGNSNANKINVGSNPAGTQRTITAGAVSLSDVRFQDIDADGAAIDWTGTRLIDLGNNLNITFSGASATMYWVGGTGSWSDAAVHWATSSSGSPGAANLPGPDNNVVFDSASNASGYTVTIDSPAYTNTLTIGNPNSGVITLDGISPLTISGSLSLPTGMTNNYTGDITFNSISTGKTITTSGVSLASALYFDNGGGWQFQDALATTGAVIFIRGNLDTNSQSVSSLTFASAGVYSRIFNLGSTTWTLTGNDATIWIRSVSNFTMVGTAATIVSNYSGADGTRTFTMTDDSANNPSLSITAGTDTIVTSKESMNNLNFTGFAGTWSSSGGAQDLYGNLTLGAGMINRNTANITFSATSSKSVSAQSSMPFSIAFNSDGTKMYMLGDMGDSVYQYTLGTAWDVSTASYASLSKNVNAQDDMPRGLAFSSDGTKMYVMGWVNKSVFQYALDTAWDVSTASYASLSKNVNAQDTSPGSVTFSSDGTKMYIMGETNDTVYQYTLSTPWVVSEANATYSGLSKSVTTQEASPHGLTFSSDGTKMYILGEANDTVYQYTLSTPWVVSEANATYSGLFKSVTAQASYPYGLTFSSDGTKMFIIGNATVYQYTLGGAWDASSVNLTTNTKTITSNGASLASALTFNGIGGSWQLQDAMVTTGAATLTNGYLDTNDQSMSSLTFATAAGIKTLDLGSSTWTLTGGGATIWSWSVTTATMLGTGGTIAANFGGSAGTRTITMGNEPGNPDLSITNGADIVIITATTNMKNLNFTGFSGTLSATSGALSIYGNLTLGTGMTNLYTAAITFAATTPKSVTAQDTAPYGATFNSDGTKMYIIGNTNDTVYQYTLGTAWDVSTAVYASLSKSVTAQDTYPMGVAFSSDGTKMYIMGFTNKTVYQYTLGTAWDVSTANYDTPVFKSVNAQDASPYNVAFNSDGTRMYIMGASNDTVFQYTIDPAHPWDVSYANYDTPVFKSVNAQESNPMGVAFNSDGTKMYIVGWTNDTVYQYTLSTPWVVSEANATYSGLFKSVTAQDTNPYGVTFNSDGTKMYIMGNTNDTVYSYDLGVPWAVDSANVSIAAKTITSNGRALASALTFNSLYGRWQLQDALANSSTVTLTNGYLDTNSKDVRSTSFATAAGIKTLNLGTSTWTVTLNNTTIWNWSNTTATMIGNMGTIASNYSGATGTRTITMGTDIANPSLSITAGTDIVSITAATLGSLNFTDFSGTLAAASGAMTLYGDLTLSPTMTNSYTAAITFAATSGKSVTTQDTAPVGITFNSDGTKMYVMGYTNQTVYQYVLGTAWDASAAAYTGLFKSTNAQDIWARTISFNTDGTKMYLLGGNTDIVYQYTLGTAWDVSTASYIQPSPSVSTQDDGPVGFAFNSDGTKMYMMGNNNDTVYQYTLNPAWDVSTAAYDSLSKNVGSQEPNPRGLAFNSDGTKMYVMGIDNDTVYQYTLSTPWVVSEANATYSGLSKNIQAQDTNPFDVTFSSDGTKMYIAGSTNDTIYQYTLSTPWETSEASASVSTNAKNITSSSKALAGHLTFNGVGGKWQLQDALQISNSAKNTTLTNGTLDANNKDVTIGVFSSNNSNPRTLIKGAGTWTLTGTMDEIWNMGTGTNLTLNDTGTIKFTDNQAFSKNFVGGGKTYNNFWNATAGTGYVLITDSNTFNNFQIDAGRTQKFTAGTTQTVNTFTALGSANSLVTLDSTTTSPFFLIKSGSGKILADYISVNHSTVTPDTNTWYAGPLTHSTDGGSNSGWIFENPISTNVIRGNVGARGTVALNKVVPWDCGNILTYNGDNYTTVQMSGAYGNQCWLGENLRTTKKPDGTDLTEGSGMYSNPAGYGSPWGRLYDWTTAMNGASAASACGAKIQGICPTGWHIPSAYYGTSCPNDDFFVLSTTDGGASKQAGTTNWNSPNTGATNLSGWTGYPAGNWTSGYASRGNVGSFWASSYNTDPWFTGGYYASLAYNDNYWFIFSGSFTAVSVRCVKD